MKKTISTFLAALMVFSMLLTPALAWEDPYEWRVYTFDQILSEDRISFGDGNYYTKYTVNAPAVLRIDNPEYLAIINVYKVDISKLVSPIKYYHENYRVQEPLSWDEKGYTIFLYDDNGNPAGFKEVFEEPGDEYKYQYEITSGYITLKDPGFYLVCYFPWDAAGELDLVEVVAEDSPYQDIELPYTIVGLNNFVKKNTYVEGQFKDISSSAWYAKDVKTAYELGLMQGKGEGKFDPQGNISIAEAITMAARVHKIYEGKDPVFENTGTHWYDGALSYAIDNRIIFREDFQEFDRPATRAELARIFSRALPYQEYGAINDIAELPDVNFETKYHEDIFKLYNAGIVTGSDENLTFKPEANISRAEVAAIITRVVNPEARKQI